MSAPLGQLAHLTPVASSTNIFLSEQKVWSQSYMLYPLYSTRLEAKDQLEFVPCYTPLVMPLPK